MLLTHLSGNLDGTLLFSRTRGLISPSFRVTAVKSGKIIQAGRLHLILSLGATATRVKQI